jgi:hypothetical protein
MQKGQKIEDKHAGTWGQVCWVLGWRHTTALLLLFYFSYFASFSLFFETLRLFYSLKSWSSDLHCPMFPLISSIIPKVLVLRLPDTQHQQLPAASAAATPHKKPSPSQAASQLPPSVSLLYTVANKEVEPQLSVSGVAL